MTDSMLTLIINAKNLTAPQLKELQRDLKRVGDEGDKSGVILARAGTIAKGGLSLGLAAAAKGAMELSSVQADLQAQTGMSADEAKRATEAINAMSGRNLVPLGTLSDTMTKVHNDLGLTGDAATTTTELFAKFERATKQGAESVAAFDDVEDAWNLTAADTQSLMDKLIVSRNKYGGSIAENTAALAAMAPAMKATNMSVDDGIALLNLFNKSGINAADAAGMVTKAVKGLKPGQDLNDLIAQLGAIADPTDRAQKAIELFGKSGAKMGSAITPGMTSLDDLKASLGDVTGATTKAADAMDSSFPAAVQKGMALATSYVRGFGDNFGPALMGGAALASFASAFSGLIPAAWAAALPTIGVLTLPVVAVLVAGGAGVGPLGPALQDQIDKGMGQVEWHGPKWDVEAENKKNAEAIAKQTAEAAHLWRLSAQQQVYAMGAGLTEATPVAKAAASEVANSAGQAFIAAWQQHADARTATATVMTGVRQAIIAGRSGIVSAWTDVLSARNRAADIADQLIINHAERTAALKVLHDKKATAAEKAEANTRLRNLKAEESALLLEQTMAGTRQQQIAKLHALNTSKEMKNGLASQDPAIKQHWIDLRTAIQTQLGNLENSTYTYGANTARNYAAGLKSGRLVVGNAANDLVAEATKRLRVRSPAEEGPLSLDGGPEGMGANVIRLYARGMRSALGSISAVTSDAAGAALFGGSMGMGLGMGMGGTMTLRHVVEFRGPAPAGVTARGIAAVLQSGVDASGLVRNLRHLGGVR